MNNSCVAEVYYHSIFSKLPEDQEFDLVIFDEGHHEPALTFQRYLDRIGSGGMPLVMLTATPNRPDRSIVKWDALVETITREEAVRSGTIAQTELTTVVDFSSHMNKVPITFDIIEHFKAEFGQTMVFMRTRDEVRDLTTKLNDAGVVAVAIDNQDKRQLTGVLKDFSAGRIQMLINCKKISEGVDVKGCDTVFIAKHVGSATLINQMVGRSVRPDSESRVWELVNPWKANEGVSRAIGGLKSHRVIKRTTDNTWAKINLPVE